MKKISVETSAAQAEKLVAELCVIIPTLGGGFTTAESDVIDTKRFAARTEHIVSLMGLLSRLDAARASLGGVIDVCNAAKETELRALEQLVTGKSSPPHLLQTGALNASPITQHTSGSAEWSTVTRRDKRAVWGKPAPPAPICALPHMQTLKPRLVGGLSDHTPVSVTAGITLQAVTVDAFEDVRQNGELHYIKSADHFAIKIAGVLFHGNIGVVYGAEKDPEKIRDCRFPNCTKSRCTYYHDPKTHPGSRDRRNFTAESFVVSPRKNPRNRTFGSIKSLDEDIALVTSEETARHQSQVMHDILCALAAVVAGKQR